MENIPQGYGLADEKQIFTHEADDTEEDTYREIELSKMETDINVLIDKELTQGFRDARIRDSMYLLGQEFDNVLANPNLDLEIKQKEYQRVKERIIEARLADMGHVCHVCK